MDFITYTIIIVLIAIILNILVRVNRINKAKTNADIILSFYNRYNKISDTERDTFDNIRYRNKLIILASLNSETEYYIDLYVKSRIRYTRSELILKLSRGS